MSASYVLPLAVNPMLCSPLSSALASSTPLSLSLLVATLVMLFSFRLSTRYRLPVDFDASGYVGWHMLKGILRVIFVGRFMERIWYNVELVLYWVLGSL